MSRYSIEESTIKGIADAVRNMRTERKPMTPDEIIEKINDSKIGIPISVTNRINSDTGEWVRPKEWPDIDALGRKLGDSEDCLYLTYDLTKMPGLGWIGFYARTTTGSTLQLSRGHVENETGRFIEDEFFKVDSGSYFAKKLEESNGDIQLWRLYPISGHIERFGFTSNFPISDNPLPNNYQPCVQRSGKLPFCYNLSGGVGTSEGFMIMGTIWLERDSFVPGKARPITDLSNCWTLCYSLQSLDLSSWDTTEWAVTNLTTTFNECYSLQSLDLSSWNTKGWKVTTLQNMFYGCYSLQSLDLSSWDTTEWAVTSLVNMFGLCYSLQSLDLSSWNTKGWKVTTLQNMFYDCYSLKSLDLSSWDTTEWVVTAISAMFHFCYSLQSLDLSSWNTKGWKPTSLFNMFYRCYSLQSLDVSSWDTTNWKVKNISSMFNSCYSLQSLDLSSWDTKGWEVTTLQNTFYDCHSLRSLDLSSWDTTGWTVTNINSCWSSCYSLQSIDVSDWNMSQWKTSSPSSVFSGTIFLKEIKGFEKEGSIVDSSSETISFAASLFLTDCSGFSLDVNYNYEKCIMLTRESLINILNALPKVSTTKTITLGPSNLLKLTSTDISIATQKGWTVN